MNLFDISHPWLKKTLSTFKSACCFLAIIFLYVFASCETPQKGNAQATSALSIEERKWMEKFFRDVMLKETCIYTLLGTKPMSVVVLHHFTDEEIQAWIDQMTEEEKKELIVCPEPYDLPENWKKWEQIRDRFSLVRYLFFKRERATDPRFEDIYFVNIQQTALTIQQNYDLFKRYVGEDFDPLEVVFEIENPDSLFWKESLHNSVLLGILFGFGVQNSFCFEWKYWSYPDENKKMEKFLDSLKSRFEQDHREFTLPSPSHFSLPAFASFSDKNEDEVIQKYKMERDEIQKIYRGKNFLDLTLQKLTATSN